MNEEEELRLTVNEITEALTAPLPRVTMNVDLFREFFGPLFSNGGLERADLITKWVEYAGGPHCPVDIVNSEGVVLETVPGIVSGMNPVVGGRVAQVMQEHKVRLGSQPPIVANNFLTGQFKSLAYEIEQTGKTLVGRFDDVKKLVDDNTVVVPTKDTLSSGDGLDFT